MNAGGRFVIGVMVKPMAADFGWSRSAISAAIFLNMAVYALSIVITGRLYDRYGPKWIIVGSTVLFSAGYALMAAMGSLWEFLLYFGVVNAAGLGGTTVAIVRLGHRELVRETARSRRQPRLQPATASASSSSSRCSRT